MGKSVLVVFDFDNTLVDCNTDIEVRKLSPGGDIPEKVKKMSSKMGWTEFMQVVFDYLYEEKVTAQRMKKFMRSLPLTPGVKELIPHLKNKLQAEIIIISDANSFFITEIVEAKGLSPYITALFTHEAVFEGDHLKITRLNPEVVCKKGAGKMCKGHILLEYLDKRKAEEMDFNVIKYVGDGLNDFCPMTKLPQGPKGVAYVRKGFPLDKYLSKSESSRHEIGADLIVWSDISVVADD